MWLLVLAALPYAVHTEVETTECLFEFNKAYSWNQAGMERLKAAQNRVSEARIDRAAEHYRQAIDLLQKSIQHYRQLPELAFDCSPANLSIARNNIRVARENLEQARAGFDGLDCMKVLEELESLSRLASEYYHQHHDAESALQSANDALALADTIEQDGTCSGEYTADLGAQRDYAQQVVDSLKERGRYERCLDFLKQATTEYRQAQESAAGAGRKAWQGVVEIVDEGTTAAVCDSPYREQLESLGSRAREKLGPEDN